MARRRAREPYLPASVASYKPFERYVEAVQSLFDRTEKIVGWNVAFDLSFLENEASSYRRQRR